MTSPADWPPRTPVAGVCLLRSADGRVLMLRPTYRPGWSLPGGAVDVGESPLAGALRELHEETGIVRRSARLACVDYCAAEAGGTAWVRFLFDAGRLHEAELDAVVLQHDEIAEWRLMDPADAVASFDEESSRRFLATALERDGKPPVYTEGGLPVS